MADYDSAFKTSLGDYLSWRAAREHTTRSDLESRIEITPIAVIKNHHSSVFQDFNTLAGPYDVVVEIEEGPVDDSGTYLIRATGIKFTDSKKDD